MSFLDVISVPELRFGDFLVPWGLIVGTVGFLLAWLLMAVFERLGWTRHIWHLPLFFVALAVFLGCILGLLLSP